MLNGVELIRQERNEQIVKHGRTLQSDILINANCELCWAASLLMHTPDQESPMELISIARLSNWDQELLMKMDSKPYKERLIIAGALIAAEIDRLQAIGEERKEDG